MVSETDSGRPPAPAWRTASFPWYVLAGGWLLVVAATLGLASLGGVAGIAGAAVLLGLVVALIGVWCQSPVPTDSNSVPTAPDAP